MTWDLPGHTDLVPKAPTTPQRADPQTPAGCASAAWHRVGGTPTSTVAVGIMSGATRSGPWVVPTQFTALALMGGVDLDLTQAWFAAREVTITAVAIMGGIDITVPDDITVMVNGFGFMGAFEDNAHVRAARRTGGPDQRAGPHGRGRRAAAKKNAAQGAVTRPAGSSAESLENTPDTLAWTNPAAPCTAGWSATLELHRLICSYRSRPALRTEHVADADAQHKAKHPVEPPSVTPGGGTSGQQSSLSAARFCPACPVPVTRHSRRVTRSRTGHRLGSDRSELWAILV